jgi:hypothetical protein
LHPNINGFLGDLTHFSLDSSFPVAIFVVIARSIIRFHLRVQSGIGWMTQPLIFFPLLFMFCKFMREFIRLVRSGHYFGGWLLRSGVWSCGCE